MSEDSPRQDFKKTFDRTASRDKRVAVSLNARKQRRFESLRKKRSNFQSNDASNFINFQEHYETIVNEIKSENPDDWFQAAQKIRKLLSKPEEPPIQQVIDAHFLQPLINFLRVTSHPELQYEACWALTNISSGEDYHTAAVFDAGAVPYLVELLNSDNEKGAGQALWAIGNIAGDNIGYRDAVIAHGGLAAIVPSFKSKHLPVLRNAAWTLANLVRGKPMPPLELIMPVLSVFRRVLAINDQELLVDTCWALSYISDGDDDRIQAVINSGVLPLLLNLLEVDTPSLKIPALRTIGNFVSGNSHQTQSVLNSDPFPKILPMFYDEKKSIRKEACWLVSNITAGSKSQIQAVIDADVMPRIISLMDESEPFEIRKEACWTIVNAMSGGEPTQVRYIASIPGCIHNLLRLVLCPDGSLVETILETFDELLTLGDQIMKDTGKRDNPYAIQIERNDGLELLESLAEHESYSIYTLSMELLETYFGAEPIDNLEDDPKISFNFGTIMPGAFSF